MPQLSLSLLSQAVISPNHVYSTCPNLKIIFPDKHDKTRIGVEQFCFLHIIYFTISSVLNKAMTFSGSKSICSKPASVGGRTARFQDSLE